MKIVELLYDRSFMFKGTPTWVDKGQIFEVLEEKILPLMGLGYKIKDLKYGCVMEGWHTAKDFDIVRED